MKVIPFSNLLRSGFCPPYARLIVACLFFPLIFLSCKKDKAVEISDLKFPLDTYYVPVGGELSIDVQQGNQKYTVSAKDDKLLQTTIQTANPPAGNLRISGLKKGNTQLTVRDEVTGQSAVLQIHVVDPYLVLKIVSFHTLKVPIQTLINLSERKSGMIHKNSGIFRMVNF